MANSNLIQRHPFHLVDTSPWPFVAGMSALSLTTGFVMYMQCYQGGFYVFSFGFISLLFTFFVWWRDRLHTGRMIDLLYACRQFVFIK